MAVPPPRVHVVREVNGSWCWPQLHNISREDLATDLRYLCPGFHLPQNRNDMLFRVTLLGHRSRLLSRNSAQAYL